MPAHRRTHETPRELAARRRAAIAIAVMLPLLGVSEARADEVPEVEAPEPSRFAPLNLDISLGGFGANHGAGMVMVGLAVIGHHRCLEGGVLAEGAAQVFGGSMGGIALLGGVGVDVLPRLRLGLLGELGRHGYSGNDEEDLLSVPSPGGALPYAGVRAGVAVAIGDRGITIGFWLFVRDDIGQRDVTYTYRASGIFVTPHDVTSVGHVGSLQTGATFRLGAAF